MAKIEFFRVKVINKKTKNLENINLSDLIQNIINSMTHSEKYCKNKNCDATIADHIKNNVDNITFDFIKFTQEIIHSTIIGEPEKQIDTFKMLNNQIIDSTEYKNSDLKTVKKIITKNSQTILSIKKDLEESKLGNFVIYKIIKENDLDRIENEETLSNIFYKENLERLKKIKTFFNLTYYHDKHNILLLQNIADGFKYKKLEEYLNYYILKETDYNIHIDYIYESDFMDNLQNSNLKQFKFSFNLNSKSILDEKDFNSLFKRLSGQLGAHNITISANAEKDSFLNNKDLLDFFKLATDSGLFSNVQIKKDKDRKMIDSNSNGSVLSFSNNSKIEDINDANQNFLKAFDEKEPIISEKIWM